MIEIALKVHDVLMALGAVSFCAAIWICITDSAPEDEDTRYVLHTVFEFVELMITLGMLFVIGIWVE